MNRFKHYVALLPALAVMASCSQEAPEMPALSDKNCIVATIADPAATRTCIDGDINSDAIGVAWTGGDQLGAFASKTGAQVLYTKVNNEKEAKEAVFAAQADAPAITPVYAYYPYSADNAGRSLTDLAGTLPTDQDMESGNLVGDYKIGRAVGSGNATDGYNFEFRHLFSLGRVSVNAEGTDLQGDKLVSVALTVEGRTLAGNFTFNVLNGKYSVSGATSSTITAKWGNTPQLNGEINGYVSLMPNVKAGDKLVFTITTDKHVATLTVQSKVDFEGEGLYNFPLTLSNYANKEGFEIVPVGGEETLTGTFTCATYNVDGLPNISGINKDGPGADGTKLIGSRINISNWDFFGVSEDFEHHEVLENALSNYMAGTYRGTVTSAQISSRADTDGLEFFWRKNIEVMGETFIKFKNEYGDLTGGANTCIKKGFRYYLVKLADGTEIDVYITHMNTYSSGNVFTPASNWLNAANGQLTEIADYIKEHQNRRPIVVMGDTNCRYTRHLVKQNLIDAINADSNLEIVDPWIDLAWKNDFSSVGGDRFPQYGGKSLMTSDATGTNSSTDIIISEVDGGLQKGEVVDKVFYINCKNAKTQLKAKSYLRDISFKDANGKALADHYPVVVEFSYTTKK